MANSASENEIFSTITKGTRKKRISQSIGNARTATRPKCCGRTLTPILRRRSIIADDGTGSFPGQVYGHVAQESLFGLACAVGERRTYLATGFEPHQEHRQFPQVGYIPNLAAGPVIGSCGRLARKVDLLRSYGHP